MRGALSSFAPRDENDASPFPRPGRKLSFTPTDTIKDGPERPSFAVTPANAATSSRPNEASCLVAPTNAALYSAPTDATFFFATAPVEGRRRTNKRRPLIRVRVEDEKENK